MTARLKWWFIIAVSTAFVTIASGTANALPAGPELSLTASPSLVRNGGSVQLTGHTTCGHVRFVTFAEHQSFGRVGQLFAVDKSGNFSVRLQLPILTNVQESSSVSQMLTIEAFCDTSSPPAATTVSVTGIELARTGSSAQTLLIAGTVVMMAGAALAAVDRRCRRRSSATPED